MSFSSIIKTLRCGDSSLKLIYIIEAIGPCEDASDEVSIDNLVNVGLRWNSTRNVEGVYKIEFYYSLEKHPNDYRLIKTNITSNDLKYSRTGIHTPEDWSDWVSMGYINIRLNIAHECTPRTNWVAAIDLCITSYEVKIDTISSKLYYDEDLTDFLLSATGGKVAVHKAYLGAHSDVFKAMLKREWKETVEGQITMEGVTVHTLQHLKDYMYLGTLPNDGLQSLLLLARCYLIEDLERHCIRKLAETVQPEDLFPLLEFACENNIPELAYEMLQITQDSAVNEARKLKKAAEKQRVNTNICDCK